MPTKTLRFVVSVVYTPQSELEEIGQPQTSKLRPRSQVAPTVARTIRRQVMKTVPDDCRCSVIVGTEPEPS